MSPIAASPIPKRKAPRLTRRRVAQAAARLFAERGYGATSLKDIARAADVHVQTIYLAFGTKVAVLGAALAVAVAGDEDIDVPPAEWTWTQALVADPDPAHQLRRYAAHRRAEAPRAGPLVAQARETGRDDPAVATLLRSALADEHRGILTLAELLAARGALRPGLTPAVAADTLLATASYEGYERLVNDREWTADRYERWLGDALIALLLGGDFSPGGDDADPR